MSSSQDPLSALFVETATTTRDRAFADRVRRALPSARPFGPGMILDVLARPLMLAAALAGAGLGAAMVVQAAPYAAFVVALGAVAGALRIGRGRRLV